MRWLGSPEPSRHGVGRSTLTKSSRRDHASGSFRFSRGQAIAFDGGELGTVRLRRRRSPQGASTDRSVSCQSTLLTCIPARKRERSSLLEREFLRSPATQARDAASSRIDAETGELNHRWRKRFWPGLNRCDGPPLRMAIHQHGPGEGHERGLSTSYTKGALYRVSSPPNPPTANQQSPHRPCPRTW